MKQRCLSFLVAGALASSAVAQTNGVPAPLLAKLTNGVNVTRWFCYQPVDVDKKHFETYFTDADFAALKRLKVNFVRLCLSPDFVYKNGQPNAAVLPYVDKALARLEKAGIATIFDLHDNGQLKLDAVGQDNSGFVSFWKSIAQRYRGKMGKSVVFELVNEPVFQKNAEVWYALQKQTVAGIRAIDPKRTIMVSATGWSGIDALAQMTPLAEKNLIYTYHCYDPFMFTHQGATWAGDYVLKVKSIPFPSSPEAVDKIMDQIPADHQNDVRNYGKSRFDENYLRTRIAIAESWAKKHQVPVVLGEFGAYPPVAPVDSRSRWFAAMKNVLNQSNVRRAIWGYDDGLGLGRSIDASGKLTLDPIVLRFFYGQ